MNIEPKKIAEIIKKYGGYTNIQHNFIIIGDEFINDLADLFEREDKRIHSIDGMKPEQLIKTFNPKEFKEQCGVK